MTGTIDHRPAAQTDHSVGDLVRQASEQLSTLVRQELRLAQVEMVHKGKRAGIGGGLFTGAGLFGLVALLAAVTAGIAALHLALPLWAAALVMTGFLLIVAGVMALLGKKELSGAAPAKPDHAIGSVRTDVEEIKERAHP
ncbi:phage holin family protein [Streptomyces sp. NPDC059740]|uniref:phage holin family protein n=1 Tax=Streptomyces sp. NPDC059740 TaxID=3346926 RepID=UPI0036689ED9